MSVFETQRTPNESQIRFDRALQTAIARKNNRKKLYDERIANEQADTAKENLDAITESVTMQDNYELSKRTSKQQIRNRNRALSILEHRLVEEGYPKCFRNAIFEIVYEGFWADDEIKVKTIDTMYATFENVLADLDNLGIKPVNESEYNPYLKNVKDIVTEACKKTAKRITEKACDGDTCESEDDINSIKFTMTGDESEAMDNELSDLNPEDMSELVKAKVLQVVQDEQISAAKKADAFKEIDDSKKKIKIEIETEDDEDEDEDKEDKMDGDKEDEKDDDMDEETTKESVSLESALLQAKIRKMNRKKIGTSLFECLMMGSAKVITENAMESIDNANKMDVMDAAFMESVLTYTILETLQTVGLYRFEPRDIETIKNHYKKR